MALLEPGEAAASSLQTAARAKLSVLSRACTLSVVWSPTGDIAMYFAGHDINHFRQIEAIVSGFRD